MTNNKLISSPLSIITLLMLFFTQMGFAQNQNAPTLVKDIAVGSATSQLRSLVTLNTKAYFVANNGSDKLYQTDGTTNGTSQVTGYTDDVTSNVVAWNGQIYFTTKRANATQGTRILLYKTNGTTAVFVDTLFNNTTATSTDGYNLTRLYVENNKLLYSLQTLYYQGSSISLSSHNGQRNGGKLITGIGFDSRSGGATTYSQSSVFVGTNTFYVYEEGGSFGNNSIGKTLSVVRNTTPVSERIIFQRGWFSSNPPPADFQFTALGVIGDFLYAINKDTLFRYDSTGLRTLIKTGFGSFNGFRPIKVGNQLYIKDGNNDLWRTDGTAAGSIKLARTGLQPTELLGDLFTDGTDLYIKTIISGVFPGFRRVIGNAITTGYGGTGTEASNGDPIFANGKVYFTTSPNSPCTIGLIEYNPTTNTNQYFPLVTQANCSQSVGTNRVVLPNNTLLFDFSTATTGLELFKLDLNPPAVTLPDFSIRISNSRVNTSQVGTPRDPYSTPTSLDYVITASNLDLTDTRPLNVRAYVSNDSIFSADDAPLVFQSLSQRDLPFNLITNGFPVSLRTAGLTYIFLKVDSENGVVEANENNNVSNPLPVDVYAVSCASNGVSPYNEWVSNVKFNTINNTSEKTRYGNIFGFQVGYSNFLDVSTTVNKGQSYPLSITPSLGYPTYPTNLFTRVWIDYNQNGIFEDAEIVLAKNGNQVATQNIIVPTTALIGTTAMRVSMKAGAYPTACEVFDKGEVEDYTVNIQNETVVNLPDLVLSGFLNTSVVSGQSIVDGQLYLKNIGTVPVTSNFFTVNLYLSTDAALSANDALIANVQVRNVTTIAAGDSVAISPSSFLIPNNTLAGNYFFIFKADGNNAIAEASETNNTLAQTASVRNPNLVASCGIFPSIPTNSTITRGESYDITHQLSSFNSGVPRQDKFSIKVYFSRDLTLSADDYIIKDTTGIFLFDATSAGIAFFNTALVPTSFTNGVYNIVYELDQPNTVFESNETDNKCSIQVNWKSGIVPNNSCRYQDSLQLVSIYNATNGANWTIKWNLAQPISTWNGVTLNTNGCVEGIVLLGNNLTGTLPNVSLSSLKFINLSSNKITGAIPNFNNVPILEELVLANNLLTGAIPNLSLPNLRFLILYTNQLSGSVPNLSLQNLVTFDAHDNKLTGAIPDFNLTKIINLVLDHNLLTGLPNFGTMPLLEILDLNSNQLTGSIPSFFLPSLKSLILATNKLTGSIPTFTLPNLQSLILFNNQLSGCLPASLKTYCGKIVNISGNVGLSNQNFATFCSSNTGACVPTSNEDITLTISSTPSVYNQFQTNTFKITAKNNKVTALANVKVEFKFPAKTVSGGTAVASTGTWQEWCPGGVPCYTWTIPNLAAGTTATLDVPLFILDATAPIVATTKVLAATPQASSNVATVTVNRANAVQAPPSQALAFQVPTQLVPVVIQAISPNPTESDIVVKLDSWTKQDVDFNFSDITGKTILSEKRTLDKGLNRVAFDVNYLPQGVYFIQTNVGKGRNVPTKFVKM